MYFKDPKETRGLRTEGFGGLDRIRLKLGNSRLPEFFTDLYSNNPEHARLLINSSNTSFTAIYILKPVIENTGLTEGLKPRHKKAVEFIDAVRTVRNSDSYGDRHEKGNLIYDEELYRTAKWIIATGAYDDGLDDLFDEILDVSAIILVKEFKDTSYLRRILDLIFLRHGKGTFYHDLTWAFFSCASPDTIKMAAKKLCSRRLKDIELAKKLLKFIPGMENQKGASGSYACYQTCIRWLRENERFLYYTGESYQKTDSPCPFAVSLGAKYLQKALPEGSRKAEGGSVPGRLDEREAGLLYEFNGLSTEDKKLLSGFSSSLRAKSRRKWEEWINSSLDVQLETAKKGLGVVV